MKKRGNPRKIKGPAFTGPWVNKWGLSLFLLLLAGAARAQVQLIISTPTYPANGSYFNLQNQTPNFNWIGPSTTTIALATSPVYNLQVNTDPSFVASPIISVSIAAVIPSTGLPKAYASYISGTSLSNNTTYYWRVFATDSSGGMSQSWSTASFVTNFANATNLSASYSGSINSLGQLTPESGFISLPSGATSQLSVTDSISGLAVSSAAMEFTGDGGSYVQGTSGYGVLYSTDAGTTWQDYSSLGIAPPSTGGGATIWNLAVFNGFLYAGLSNGDIIQTNNGTNWNNSYSGSNYGIGGFAVFNGNLYASNRDGNYAYMVSISPSNVVNRVTIAPSGVGISKPVVFNGTLFVEASYAPIFPGDPGYDNAGGGIFASQDGIHWVQTSGVGVCSDNFDQLFTFNGELYADVQSGGFGCSGLFASTDGVNWTQIENQSSPGTINAATVFNGKLYIGVNNGGANPLLYSSTNGQIWSADNGSLSNPSLGGMVNSLNVVNGKLYAGISTTTAKIYMTTDGNNWVPVISSGTGNTGAGAPVYFKGNLYAPAGTDILTLSPFTTSLSGSNGEASGTLSAISPLLAASTTTVTCGGVSPCGATNQIIFTVSDIAGNSLESGPYSILVDTEVGVAVSTPSYPANNSYVNVQPNFDWIGPSTGIASALQAPAYFNLEVSSNDPNFSPANLIINISTPVVVYSTNVPTADGAYLSPYTLANGVTYYYRINITDNLGGISPWSSTASFVTDFPPPASAASSFESFNSQSLPTPEGTFNDLALGVTAQITVQDGVSGLAVSTDAIVLSGDSTNGLSGGYGGFGVLYSTNGGANWIGYSTYTLSSPVPALGCGGPGYLQYLSVFNGNLIAENPDANCSNGRIYYLSSNSWSQAYSASSNMGGLTIFNGYIYSTNGNSIVRSLTGTSGWSTIATISSALSSLTAIGTFGDKIIAGVGTYAQIFTSEDGVNWFQSQGALGGCCTNITTITSFNGRAYAGTSGTVNSILYSLDGINWAGNLDPNTSEGVTSLGVFNGKIYVGLSGGDIYSSPDPVISGWTKVFSAGTGTSINGMTSFNGGLYVSVGSGTVATIIASPDGSNWMRILSNAGIGVGLSGLAGFNGQLYAGEGSTSDPAAVIINPLNATLPGSNGTTAAETLSATSLNLVQSTSNVTCGGVSPCGATDQVIFTVSDMAGNTKGYGPYAVLVDTTVATAISTPSYPVSGQYVGLNPNFNWTGPSTSTVLGLSQPASFILEVSNNDPNFGTSVINITEPIVVNSTAVATADGAYISTYTLLNATTYYWRVRTLDGFGGLGPWSEVTSFVTDFTPPSTSAFASLDKSGGLVPESQVTVLISGVTAQLTLQDSESGLAVSSAALSFLGDGHDDPFAASGYGVIYSTDAGETWIDSSTHSVISNIISGPATPAYSMAVYNGEIYAALHSALQSSPDGINWSAVSDASGTPTALSVFNGELFIGDPGGRIFNNPNLSAPVFTAASSIESLSAFNERIYAGDLNGHVYASSDGIHWGLVFSDTQTAPSVQSLMGFNGQIYAGDASGNIYQSGNGTLWTDVFKGNNISALSVFNQKIYAADSNNGKIYVSSDGVHWNIAFSGPSGAYSFTLFEGKLYAGYLASAYETPDGIHWAQSVFDGAMGNVDSLSGFNQILYLGDSNGVLWKSSSVFASLTGLNGITSSEILSAYGLNLAASTDTYICDNANPCGATNQVMFTGSNMAGDDISAGPFAIIVDTHSTDVLISTTNIAPSQMPQNTVQGFTRLVMNALAGTADWNGLVIHRLGSSVDSDISNDAIYRDSLNNGVFVATADAQISNSAVFSAGVASVTLVSPEGIGVSTQSYFIALQAAPAATDGDVVISEVLSSASFSFSNGYQMSSAQSIYPFASSPSTIVDGPNNLYITPYNTAPADLAPGTTQVPLLSLKNYTNTGTSTYSKIVFHLLGTAASSDISSISVYRDVNNTGVFAPNDTLLTSGADGFAGGVSTVDFTASAASDTINMTPVYLFVVVNLSPSAPLGDTFGVEISTPSDVYIDPLDTTLFTSTPVASSLVTVEYINTLNVQGVSQIPPSLLQGQEYTVLKASFTVSTGKTAFNGLDITRLGLGHDSDVSSVKVWQDPNPPEAFNPATFQLLGSGTFNSGTAQINFSTQTLSAGTTYVYYVTYDISPTAIQGDTLGGRITSNLDVTDTNPGTTIVGNFSINSATSPVVPTTAGLFVSAQNVAPSDLLQGATNQQMLNLTMDTTQYTVALTALTFNSLGTASSSDISRVEVYQDTAGNGILNTASDPLLAAVSFPFISGTGIIPFSAPGITISTTPIRLLVAVDVSTGANYINNDFGIGISTSSNISINAPNFVVPSTQTFPADSSIIPITKAPDVMSVYPTSLINPLGVVQGQNAPAAKLFLQTQHSSVTWTTISIQRNGTLPDSGIDSVNIYYDADQNGVFDSSDILVGSATFVSAQANISFSSAQLVNPQGSNYFITLQIDPNATPGDTVGISLSGASNFTVAPPDSVSGSSLPFDSALAPVLNIKTPTQPIITFPNGDFSSSFDSIGFIWYSTVAVGSISSAAYAVGTTPGGTDIAPYTAIPFAASSFTAVNLLLSNGATYYVSVEATSSFGFTSPAGTSPGFLVDLITPGSPTNLAANIGVSSIYLTWDPGSAGPSGLSGYLLEYSDVEHPTWYNAKTGAVTALAAGPHGTLSANFIPSAPFLFNNPPQGTLMFRVSSVNGAGVQSSPSNTIRVLFGTQSTAGISNVSSYPNPFNSNSGVATIVYTLDAPGNVTIEIYSVFGNLVRSMSFSGGGAGGEQGVNTVTWDGSDAGGRKVSKGIYIAILKANGATVQYKIGVIH